MNDEITITYISILYPLTNDNISMIYSVHKTRKMRDYAAGVIGTKDVEMMLQKGGRKGRSQI